MSFAPHCAASLAAAVALVASVLSAPPAAAQSDAVDTCRDLSRSPGVVAEACRRAAEDGALSVEDRAAAAFRSGGAYLKIEAYAEAEAALSLAVELRPDFADAFASRARAREKLGDVAAAEADHVEAVALSPRDPIMVYNRGVFYFRADMEEKARDDFYTALDLDPTAGWPHVYLGAIDDLKGDDSLALEEYEAAFELDPSILTQFQVSMESQGFDPGLPGSYSPEMRAGLIECMKTDCVIGVND